MKGKPPKGKPSAGEPTLGAPADELPERWSVQRKTELVGGAGCRVAGEPGAGP